MSRAVRLVPFIGLSLAIMLSLTACGWKDASASVPSSSPTTSATPHPTPTPTPTVDLAQCRRDAVTTYLVAQGFPANEILVGEQNITPDFNGGQLTTGGSLNFWKPVTTRKGMADFLASSNTRAQASIETERSMLVTPVSDAVFRNPDAWEVAQVLTPSWTLGNKGLTQTNTVTEVGNSPRAAGDGGWFFVDLTTCQVVQTKDTSSKGIGNNTPVAMIRPGCGNVTEGLSPKDPSQDPSRRGNDGAPGASQNTNPGLDGYVPPTSVPVVPSTPHTNPSSPSPSPTPPTGSTPDPVKPPVKEQPGDPVVPPTCAPAPGKTTC